MKRAALREAQEEYDRHMQHALQVWERFRTGWCGVVWCVVCAASLRASAPSQHSGLAGRQYRAYSGRQAVHCPPPV